MRRRPVRWAIQRHLAGTAVVFACVVVVAVLIADRLAAAEALRHAEVDARLLAAEYVAPLGVDDLHSDDSTAREAMARALESRIDAGSLRRVKIWAPRSDGQGEIVFSDRAALEGQVVDLGPQYRLFGTTGTMSNRVSAADYDDVDLDSTVEVYVGFLDRDKSPFIFEAYLPTPQMAISRGELLREWLPLVLGSLLLLTLLTLPLSIRLARRVSAAERDRRIAVGSALESVLDERRRLSRRLHDGVVQDLAGVSLALEGLAARSDDVETRALLSRTVDLVRSDLSELRAVGEELFVDRVEQFGLTDAIEELIDTTECGSAVVRLQVDPGLALEQQTSLLAYRVVREGLLNAVTHGRAELISISLLVSEVSVEITVDDDGQGFDTSAATPGHWGLQLLQVATADLGGLFELTSHPGVGTRLSVTLPVPG